MLNCPKCIGKLEEKKVEGVTVDVYWVCEGYGLTVEKFINCVTVL